MDVEKTYKVLVIINQTSLQCVFVAQLCFLIIINIQNKVNCKTPMLNLSYVGFTNGVRVESYP